MAAVDVKRDHLVRAPVREPHTPVVPARRLTEHHAFHEDFRHGHHVSPSACYRDRPCPAAEFIARPPASLLTEGRLALLLRMAGQPARMVGGEWLLRICLPSGLRASVVPSGWRMSCQLSLAYALDPYAEVPLKLGGGEAAAHLAGDSEVDAAQAPRALRTADPRLRPDPDGEGSAPV